MRLFHASEESNIEKFVPRIPYRQDMDKSKGLVWALTEHQLEKFLTPRDCPRVTYCVNETTTQDDIEKFFSSSSRYCIAIEQDWYEKMANTTLYVYEFDTANFYFDNIAGFYVSDKIEKPVSVTKYDDLFGELFKRDIEVRILNNLWTLIEAVKKSSLHLSLCRIGNAKAKPAEK
jgi:hypothetical protein